MVQLNARKLVHSTGEMFGRVAPMPHLSAGSSHLQVALSHRTAVLRNSVANWSSNRSPQDALAVQAQWRISAQKWVGKLVRFGISGRADQSLTGTTHACLISKYN
jgi:hypothetical protein